MNPMQTAPAAAPPMPMGATTPMTDPSGGPGLMNALASSITDIKADKVQREAPETDEGTRKLVSQWQETIRLDRAHFNEDFKRMREDMEYARLGAKKEWVDDDKYVVPIINRHINLAVASLYAKNPTAQAKRKKKLRYKIWDGTPDMAKAAFELAQTTGDPTAQAVLQEILDAKSTDQLIDRLGKTLELLFAYYTGENMPNFKQQMKQCVRRAKTCGVAYVEVGYQRILEADPDITRRIDDTTQKISLVESQLADMGDNILDDTAAEAAELKTMLADLQQQEMIITREGLTFNFPRATQVFPHKDCQQMRGWVAADHITYEYHLTPEQVQQAYKIDIRKGFKQYIPGKDYTDKDVQDPDSRSNSDTRGASGQAGTKDARACVWRVQSRRTGQTFTIIDGWPGWVVPPTTPELMVNGFYTIFPLTFNDVEDEKKIIPLSDVHYLKHPQREYNNAREGKREHRIASRPLYFTRRGMIQEKEKALIRSSPAHTVIELDSLDASMSIDQLIQTRKGAPIDPNLYDTSEIVKDVMIGVGTQDANFGPTSGATATESSISENSRMSTLSSNVDDLDEFLSDVTRASGQVMLANVDQATAIEVVGPGAVWPQIDREGISKELFLDVKAGSSGRPNKAAELANMERGMPYLIQMPGINPAPLARRYMELLDLDPEEVVLEGLPSIMAINAMMAKQVQPGGGASSGVAPGQPAPANGTPASNPAQQGMQGANNMPGPGRNENDAGPQPAYPTPMAHP